MIRIEKLNKYYNKGRKNQIHVINDTNLELPSKGLIAILGPSGCGKTTLLNAIGGLDRVNKGSIFINEERITRWGSYKTDKIRNLEIGYIFQDYKLIDDMSVYDNVAMVLLMIGIKDKEEIKKRVEYILERVGMYRYRHRPCGMLSGGERQRVGIARAIVKNPGIILADEPTGNLDSKNTIEIMNIIKSISRDKLVILVTHEEEIAKFYATRILEVQDGKVILDYDNKNNNKIDYRIDNTFYLKDFKNKKEKKDKDIKIECYSDEDLQLDLKIIFKNGNIYIKNNDEGKIKVIDENSNIELIDDHYRQLDKSIYEKYSFDFDKIINKDIKLKYSSIFNIFSLIGHGFKKVFGYSFIKKILLIGFFLSSIFVTYSVSNILGLLTVNDDEFIKTNKAYLKIDINKINLADYLKYEDLSGIEYIIPGDSQVKMLLDDKSFYQTVNSNMGLTGSLASIEMIQESDLILGRMPSDELEIVIDEKVFENASGIEMMGFYEMDKIINQEVNLKKGLLNYKIVGIVSSGSPSIYVARGELLNIISNSDSVDDDMYMYGYTDDIYSMNENTVYDYNLYRDKISIVSGRVPSNDYEVIINENLKDIYKLNKEIDSVKVNDKKLVVVGYYKSEDDINNYFVSSNTKKYSLIENSKGIMIYSKDKTQTIEDFKLLGVKVLDVYETDRKEYISGIKESVRSSIIVAGIMLGISLIEVILMVRSSFLSRIKEIGIYRAIGVKKSDIYKMFTSESFAITTIASVPGVLFMSYCLHAISGISYVDNNYVMNIYVVILCIIIMYLFNIVIGLIPVFNTIRKSPSNILSSHQID